MEIADLLTHLRGLHGGLPPQLGRAAKYLVARPEEVALYSMRQLAERADVTPATMVRLAHAAGFAGFDALREPFRQWLRRGEGAYSAKARDLQADGGDAEAPLAARMLAADQAELADLLTENAPADLAETARAIGAAERVFVLGLRSCYSTAFLFHYLLSMAQDNCHLLGSGGGTFADSLRGIGAGDVLVSFSVRPYAADAVLAARHAADQGATIVAVSDSPHSPAAEVAAHRVTVGTAGPGFFHGMTAITAAAQMLASMVVARGGDKALRRIENSERQLAGFKAYWDEPSRRRHNGRPNKGA